MDFQQEYIPLGKTDIRIPPLGIGAWAWGDRMYWSYGQGYNDQDCKAVFELSLEAGINFFDTAEVYGSGRSERFLGRYLSETEKPVVIATKFMPYPWRITKGAFRRALSSSLERLDLEQIDLYQIHWPFPPRPVETWADALADAVEAGLVRAVGVSNYNEEQMRRANALLAKRGIPLASNQVVYHLLSREVEFNGLIEACRELGVTVIAYSPLAQGVLTGKYTAEKPLPGIRGRRYSRSLLERIQPFIRQMREIGRAHDGKSASQVAINWTMCKGTVPIPGAKNARQAEENIGALGWHLEETEVALLDQLSSELS